MAKAPPTAGWDVIAEQNGVVLRTTGDGSPVLVFSGLEGSGESCLHLVVPVVGTAPSGARPVRPVLVDYAAEQHATFDSLVETIAHLIEKIPRDGGDTCDVWMQSFGNLLGTSVLARTGTTATRAVMVSPFRRLPAWKVTLGPPVLRLTPDPLYRATAGPISSWQFGPDGGNKGHMFFTALGALRKDDLARRSSWLKGRDFEREFRELRAVRAKAWLGAEDRLERVKEEIAFFASLEDDGGPSLGVIGGCGHVVLPPAAIDEARRRIGAWFWKEA